MRVYDIRRERAMRLYGTMGGMKVYDTIGGGL